MARIPQYFKCSCAHCGNHIEFPQAAEGVETACPHCGQATRLARGAGMVEAAEVAASGRRWFGWGVLVVAGLVVVAGAAGGLVFWRQRQALPAPAAPRPAKVEVAVTNVAPPADTAAPAQPAGVPAGPQSELATGGVRIEKTTGSGLVHAVGVLTNNSDRQRFGVRVELDLFDGRGAKVGTAEDYRGVIEPRKTWEFRALVTEPRAVSAKVAGVREN